MGFSRQEYWSGLSFPSPGDLPNSGIEPRSPAFRADSLLAKLSGKPKNTHTHTAHPNLSGKKFLMAPQGIILAYLYQYLGQTLPSQMPYK